MARFVEFLERAGARVDLLPKAAETGLSAIYARDSSIVSPRGIVLALAPRVCLVVDGNPVTRRRLEAAGCETFAYKGTEISTRDGGGPTCLTRPLIRC